MKSLAILLPWFSFFLREKYTQGYICLVLQISIIGWPIAAIWAFVTLIKTDTKSRNHFIENSIESAPQSNEAAKKHTA